MTLETQPSVATTATIEVIFPDGSRNTVPVTASPFLIGRGEPGNHLAIPAMMLASQMGTESRERFYREARAAGALAHPGIVPVFDVGEHEGTPYMFQVRRSSMVVFEAAMRMA